MPNENVPAVNQATHCTHTQCAWPKAFSSSDHHSACACASLSSFCPDDDKQQKVAKHMWLASWLFLSSLSVQPQRSVSTGSTCPAHDTLRTRRPAHLTICLSHSFICSHSLRRRASRPGLDGGVPLLYVLANTPLPTHDPHTHRLPFPLHAQPTAVRVRCCPRPVGCFPSRLASPPQPRRRRERETSAQAQERDDQQGDGGRQAPARPALDHPGDRYVVWVWVGRM